ncbi:MAG: hypothetical protein KTR24_03325 [Saprospiraceae bacterium]|nr:hypothetical protein [Saprospiraceae bacterium]
MVFFMTVVFASMRAQQDRTALENRIEAQRIAFITERVDLTVEEAQSFWPVYNRFRDREKELNREKLPPKRIPLLSEEEAQRHLDKILETEQALVDLRETFVADLREILTAQKIMRFWQSERAFKERLVQMLRRQKSKGK